MGSLLPTPSEINTGKCFNLSVKHITPLGITRGSNMLIKINHPTEGVCHLVLISKRTFNKLCSIGDTSSIIVMLDCCETNNTYSTTMYRVLTLQF